MFIGQSRYFSLVAPSGVNIAAYTAKWELFKEKTKIKEGIPENTGSKFNIKIQTNDLFAGDYEVRVFITDPVDGFVDGYKDTFTLEK